MPDYFMKPETPALAKITDEKIAQKRKLIQSTMLLCLCVSTVGKLTNLSCDFFSISCSISYYVT